MTSTNPTVRGLEARRASLAPGAYLAIVHVSQGERLGPIGRGAVLPEVLDHIEAIETELAESRAGAELASDAYRDEVDDLRAALAAARAIPAHTQAFIDSVRELLGTAQLKRVRGDIGAKIDKLDKAMRVHDDR